MQEILEERGIPYTGEGIEGSWAAFDKIETKQRFVECGIPTAAFEVIMPDQVPSLPLPYVVKAPRAGLDRRRLYREGRGGDRPGARRRGAIRQPAADRGIHRRARN